MEAIYPFLVNTKSAHNETLKILTPDTPNQMDYLQKKTFPVTEDILKIVFSFLIPDVLVSEEEEAELVNYQFDNDEKDEDNFILVEDSTTIEQDIAKSTDEKVNKEYLILEETQTLREIEEQEQQLGQFEEFESIEKQEIQKDFQRQKQKIMKNFSSENEKMEDRLSKLKFDAKNFDFEANFTRIFESLSLIKSFTNLTLVCRGWRHFCFQNYGPNMHRFSLLFIKHVEKLHWASKLQYEKYRVMLGTWYLKNALATAGLFIFPIPTMAAIFSWNAASSLFFSGDKNKQLDNSEFDGSQKVLVSAMPLFSNQPEMITPIQKPQNKPKPKKSYFSRIKGLVTKTSTAAASPVTNFLLDIVNIGKASFQVKKSKYFLSLTPMLQPGVSKKKKIKMINDYFIANMESLHNEPSQVELPSIRITVDLLELQNRELIQFLVLKNYKVEAFSTSNKWTDGVTIYFQIYLNLDVQNFLADRLVDEKEKTSNSEKEKQMRESNSKYWSWFNLTVNSYVASSERKQNGYQQLYDFFLQEKRKKVEELEKLLEESKPNAGKSKNSFGFGKGSMRIREIFEKKFMVERSFSESKKIASYIILNKMAFDLDEQTEAFLNNFPTSYSGPAEKLKVEDIEVRRKYMEGFVRILFDSKFSFTFDPTMRNFLVNNITKNFG